MRNLLRNPKWLLYPYSLPVTDHKMTKKTNHSAASSGSIPESSVEDWSNGKGGRDNVTSSSSAAKTNLQVAYEGATELGRMYIRVGCFAILKDRPKNEWNPKTEPYKHNVYENAILDYMDKIRKGIK